MSKFKQFTKNSARKMPVIILADVSGSMETNGKIQTLNRAIAEMIDSFAQEEYANLTLPPLTLRV